jgi:hypothetical protein
VKETDLLQQGEVIVIAGTARNFKHPTSLSHERGNIAVIPTIDDVKSAAPLRLVQANKIRHRILEIRNLQQFWPTFKK